MTELKEKMDSFYKLIMNPELSNSGNSSKIIVAHNLMMIGNIAVVSHMDMAYKISGFLYKYNFLSLAKLKIKQLGGENY